ncbi:hypothetical protein KI387_024065, partial [Taxus chinensis]
VLDPHVGGADEGFSEARMIAEVSLLPERVRISAGRRPVAFSTGFVDSVHKKGEVRKQILVVVTAGWSIMCFDHNLKKLWETNIQEDFPHGAHHREIAISISNYTLKHGDVGLVIVGGRMEVQPHLLLDPFEEATIAEKNAEHHRRSAEEKEGSEDGSTNSGGNELQHFSYYAFAGWSGTQRWRQRSEDIKHHLSDSSELIPQYNYKLDAQALNSKHRGQVECREFRESILGVMPHHWERRDDTRFELAHFRKHKRNSVKKMPGKKPSSSLHKPEDKHVFGKDTNNKIVGVIGKAAEYAASSKKKKRNFYISVITNYTQLWWIPNVIVAHQKEGIEAVHLASGRTICKLHLQEGGLHADINGDGVLDHVQAVGGGGAEQTVATGTMEVLRPCWAVATSGVPVREQLFNASICRHSPFGVFHQGEFSSRTFGRMINAAPIEVATPILIPRSDGHKHRKGSHGDVLFLTSRGEVTSYSAGIHGQGAIRRWQLLTGSTWSNLPSPAGMVEEKVVPTLKAFPLHVHGSQEVVLVAGEQEATIISPGGSLLASFFLPSPPTHPVLYGDFSNDGLTDLVLVTSNGIYGFVQTRQPGALFFSSLVGCLIIVMAVILVSQHFDSKKSKLRAFERKSIDP